MQGRILKRAASCRDTPRASATPGGTRHHEIPLAIQDRSFNNDGSVRAPRSVGPGPRWGLWMSADLCRPERPDSGE